MTAEEIRAKAYGAVERAGIYRGYDFWTVVASSALGFLAEIAAQLAEMNERQSK